jgi:hypothetical protein
MPCSINVELAFVAPLYQATATLLNTEHGSKLVALVRDPALGKYIISGHKNKQLFLNDFLASKI